MSEKISKYVSYDEMVRSVTAKKHNIENKPDEKQLAAAKLLCEKVYDPLREWYGKGIFISSFFRCAKVNEVNHGSNTSQHCQGSAMDIDVNEDNPKLFDYIKKNLVFDQLIWEFGTDACPGWIHVSYSATKNRKQILKAVKRNGKTVYLPYK